MTELESYRHEVRSWLAGNLERKPPGWVPRVRGILPSPEFLDAQRALQRTLHQAGFAGITWPQEFGGQGLSPQHQKVFDEEAVAFLLPDFAPLAHTTFSVCAPTLLAHASTEFNAEHIPSILTGDSLWCQFFSEPEAGSDLAGVRTRAVRRGEDWVISGSKVWSSGAMVADFGLCLARTDWAVPKHRGLTWFAVPTGAPGLTIRPIRESGGGEEFCEEFFDEVVVPDAHRIGEVNGGWAVTGTMLVFERSAGKTSGDRVGGPPGPLPADLVELAQRRGVASDSSVRQQIARVHADDWVARQLAASISSAMTSGAGAPLASYLKLLEGELTAQRARAALEIGGSDVVAWPEDDVTSRTAALGYVNARVRSIAGGTNEMQRNAIAERVLGLPREPSYDTDRPFDEVFRAATDWSAGPRRGESRR